MPNLIKLCIFKYVQFITCQLYLSKPVKTKRLHLKFMA